MSMCDDCMEVLFTMLGCGIDDLSYALEIIRYTNMNFHDFIDNIVYSLCKKGIGNVDPVCIVYNLIRDIVKEDLGIRVDVDCSYSYTQFTNYDEKEIRQILQEIDIDELSYATRFFLDEIGIEY